MAVIRNRTERLNGHAVPHQLSIISGERFISHPICEGQSAVLPKDPESLDQRLLQVRHMAKCLLADDSVHTHVSKRNLQYVAVNDAGSFLKSDPPGQLLRACNARRGQFNTSDIGPIFVCKITHGTAKTRTEIGYARSISDPCALRQFVCGSEAAIVVLVMRKQVFRTQVRLDGHGLRAASQE